MANLKQDLLNNLGNEKYYDELELARLASEPNMKYKQKVEEMSTILKRIASLDLATQLIGKYFQDQATEEQGPATQPVQPQTQQQQANQSQPHPGQTHGE